MWGETDLFGQRDGDLRRRVRGQDGDHRRARHGEQQHRRRLRQDVHPGHGRARAGAGQVASLATAGYEIAVTSSDEWLTADGSSQARITAQVTLRRRAGRGAHGSLRGLLRHRLDQGGEGHDRQATARRARSTRPARRSASSLDHRDGHDRRHQRLGADRAAQRRAGEDRDQRSTRRSCRPTARSRAERAGRAGDGHQRQPERQHRGRVPDRGGQRPAARRDAASRTATARASSEYVARARPPGRVTIEITVRSTVPTEEELAQGARPRPGGDGLRVLLDSWTRTTGAATTGEGGRR